MFTLIKKITNKQDARSHAIEYQNWQSTQALSYGEICTCQSFFIGIAKKFNLVREFKENGII